MGELAPEVARELESAGLDLADVLRVIRAGLAEDLADGPDVTTAATIPRGMVGTANVVARRPGVMAGLYVADAVFHLVGEGNGSAARVQRVAAPIARFDPLAEPSKALR